MLFKNVFLLGNSFVKNKAACYKRARFFLQFKFIFSYIMTSKILKISSEIRDMQIWVLFWYIVHILFTFSCHRLYCSKIFAHFFQIFILVCYVFIEPQAWQRRKNLMCTHHAPSSQSGILGFKFKN